MALFSFEESCSQCGARKKSCGLCNYSYCRTHDLMHDRNLAYFGGEIYKEVKRGVVNTHNGKFDGIRMCPHPECDQPGTEICADKLCCSLFCESHINHDHMKCYYCDNLANKRSVTVLKVSCSKHEDILKLAEENYWKIKSQTDRFTNKQYSAPFYGNCQTCGVGLTRDRASIKYCSNCNAMWHGLKKQGIPGPFG